MIKHNEITNPELRLKIKTLEVYLGGNSNLKIYGTLKCSSGKRMKKVNRVFFKSEKEAIAYGYRPCGKITINSINTVGSRFPLSTFNSPLTKTFLPPRCILSKHK